MPNSFHSDFGLGGRFRGQRDASGGDGERGVGQARAIGGHNGASLGPQRRGVNAKLLRGSGDQRCARRRPGQAHAVKGIGHRRRPARDLETEELRRDMGGASQRLCQPSGVRGGEGNAFFHDRSVVVGVRGRAMADTDLGPVQVHLFRQQGGQGRLDALTHFRPRRDEGHTRLVDQDVGRQCRAAFGQITLERVGVRCRKLPPTKDDSASDGCRTDKKAAAGDGANTAHGITPPADDARRRELRRGCADRCHNGKGCPTWPHRSRHRWGRGSRPEGWPPA